jgi:origin recognition complex subunit 3
LDITLLFDRYLESSGKLINVYDWYDSFAQALEPEREEIEEANKKNKKKGKRKATDADMEVDEDTVWQQEVQARFLRSMHELDFMGFLAGTNKKVDHVARTSFDAP